MDTCERRWRFEEIDREWIILDMRTAWNIYGAGEGLEDLDSSVVLHAIIMVWELRGCTVDEWTRRAPTTDRLAALLDDLCGYLTDFCGLLDREILDVFFVLLETMNPLIDEIFVVGIVFDHVVADAKSEGTVCSWS